MSARTATLFVALLSTALVASATFGVCPIDVTKTSAAKAVITRPNGDTDGDLMTVLFQVPMETLGGVSVPNFLRSFRFSSSGSCGLTWSATTIAAGNTPDRDIDPTDSPFEAIYATGTTAGDWASTSGGWSYSRDDSGSCSMMQFKIQKNIEELISAGCLEYSGVDGAGNFLYQSEFRLERWYGLTQTFPPTGDITPTTRTTGRYVSEYFSVQVAIKKTITAGASSASAQVVNGIAVMPSTNNALSKVEIGQLDSNNFRQVKAEVTILVNYPFTVFVTEANLPTGIASVTAGVCSPSTSAPFAQFGDVCQQVITITYDADDCTTSRNVQLDASLLKYTCYSGTFAAGHCDADNAVWAFSNDATDIVLSVQIVSDVACQYQGEMYSGSVTATATFVKGQLGGGAWDHGSGSASSYLYYFGNNGDTPNQNVYVDVSITNDDNIDAPTDISSVAFSGQSTVDLGSSTTQGAVSTTTANGDGCGSITGDSFVGCLAVPLPTNIPRDNKLYDASVDVDVTVTLSASSATRKRAASNRVIKLNLDASTQVGYKSESNTGVVSGAASPATIAIAVIIAVVAVAAIGGAVLLAIVIRRSQAAAAAASA